MTQDADPREDRLRRSLASLDGLAVPSITSLAARSPRRDRAIGALIAVAAVFVAAVVAGDALSAWRAQRTASAPTPSATIASGGTFAPDSRYGLLVRRPDKTVALVDELGAQLLSMSDSVEQPKTSPNGRYIALWLRSGSGHDLRILDGITRTLGQPLFTTTEVFGRQNEGIVWASDSSAVLVASTADPVAGGQSPILVNLRAVGLDGSVRLVTTYSTFVFAPLAWDRSANVISAYAFERFQPGASTKFLRFWDDGSGRTDVVTASDSPILGDDTGKFVIAQVSCPPNPAGSTCRRFAVHDVSTYAVIAQMELPPLVLESGYWAIHFVPRSSDILTEFSRRLGALDGRFGLEVYGDAGRHSRRDLGDTVVVAIKGQVLNPNAYVRADGSAVLYVHSKNDGSGVWTGDVVDLASGARGQITTQQPLATVLLDAALVPAGTTSVSDPTLCPTGTAPRLDVERFPNGPDLHGAATPEEAIRAAYPVSGAITAHPFGTRPTAPVWLIADGKSYLASILPDGTWFVSPARLLACVPPDVTQMLDVDGYHFVVSLVADEKFAPNTNAGAAWISAIPGLGVRCQWSRTGPDLTFADDLVGTPTAYVDVDRFAPVTLNTRSDRTVGIPVDAVRDRAATMLCGVDDDNGRHGVVIDLTITPDGAHVASRFTLTVWRER